MSASAADQVSYVIVTPYSIRKSRTGGIISRLLQRTGLELVCSRMFAPCKELAEAYAGMAVTQSDNARHRATQELIGDYVRRNFSPDASGRRQRVMLLVLRGPDAVEKVKAAVGHIVNERTSGETIRDTYGDYLTDAAGKPVYFEPAVLTAPDAASVEQHLKLWAGHSEKDGGLLDSVLAYPDGSNVEKTLVLIKPDNFRFPNARPGGVIDVFSRTGLSIIGFKVHHMSVAEAEQFYGPVLPVLQDKLRGLAGSKAVSALKKEKMFETMEFNSELEKQLGDVLGPAFGQHNWEDIVGFMSGGRPSQLSTEQRAKPGTEKCVAIVYQGVDAVKKIRDVLGPTDPSKAPSGTIRKEFGETIMVNAAHASDSADNAKRELGIIGFERDSLRPLVESIYGPLG